MIPQNASAIELNRKAWEVRLSQRDLSLSLAEAALEQAGIEINELERAYALRTLGFLKRSQSNLTEAVSLLSQAHSIASRLGVLGLQRDILNQLAATQAIFGNMQLALEYTQAALSINQQLGDTAGQITNLINVGLIYDTLGRLEEAESVCLEASQKAQSIGDTRRFAEAKVNLGNVYVKKNQYTQAVHHMRQALDAANEVGFAELVTKIQVNLGQALIYLDQFAEAHHLLHQAEQIFVVHEVFEGLAHCRLYLGLLFLRQKQADLAQSVLLSGLEICQSQQMKDLELQFFERLSEVFEQQHNLEAALHYYKLFHATERKLRQLETERQLSAITAQRELDRARAEADLERIRREEMGHLVSQLERQAISDPLTGLYNRRHLETQLGQFFLEAKLETKPLAVAMLDVDNFKQVNDTYGHGVGDEVLKVVAHLIQDSLRSHDLAARYGGEEFALVIHANPEQALKVCERLRVKVQQYPWSELGANLSVTVTVGLSSNTELENHEKMLHAADANLYFGKRNGKNQVRV
jgi:diguanylate cyclase (GGDEF)-like protein